MTGSWHERARANQLPSSVIGGVPTAPACSECREPTLDLWYRDGTRYRICGPCIGSLMQLAGYMLATARRKAGAA